MAKDILAFGEPGRDAAASTSERYNIGSRGEVWAGEIIERNVPDGSLILHDVPLEVGRYTVNADHVIVRQVGFKTICVIVDAKVWQRGRYRTYEGQTRRDGAVVEHADKHALAVISAGVKQALQLSSDPTMLVAVFASDGSSRGIDIADYQPNGGTAVLGSDLARTLRTLLVEGSNAVAIPPRTILAAAKLPSASRVLPTITGAAVTGSTRAAAPVVPSPTRAVPALLVLAAATAVGVLAGLAGQVPVGFAAAVVGAFASAATGGMMTAAYRFWLRRRLLLQEFPLGSSSWLDLPWWAPLSGLAAPVALVPVAMFLAALDDLLWRVLLTAFTVAPLLGLAVYATYGWCTELPEDLERWAGHLRSTVNDAVRRGGRDAVLLGVALRPFVREDDALHALRSAGEGRALPTVHAIGRVAGITSAELDG